MDILNTQTMKAPGDLIREKMENLGWSQQDLANLLDLSLKHVNEILNNKRNITFDVAVDISMILGESVQFWMDLDTKYRYAQKKNKELLKLELLKEKAEIYKKMPIQELIQRGFLQKFSSLDELKSGIQSFWSRESSDLSFMDNLPLPAFRKGSKDYNAYFALCWYRASQIKSKDIQVANFDGQKFLDFYSKIPMYLDSEEKIPSFLDELKNMGIKFFVFKHFKQTYINGASYLDGKNPVVTLTLRYERMDNFWFTLLHELAHLRLHWDKLDSLYLINYDGSEEDSIEIEANQEAMRFYNGQELLDKYQNIKNVSDSEIKRIAREKKVHVSIIKGLFANAGIIKYNRIHGENVSISKYVGE